MIPWFLVLQWEGYRTVYATVYSDCVGGQKLWHYTHWSYIWPHGYCSVAVVKFGFRINFLIDKPFAIFFISSLIINKSTNIILLYKILGGKPHFSCLEVGALFFSAVSLYRITSFKQKVTYVYAFRLFWSCGIVHACNALFLGYIKRYHF